MSDKVINTEAIQAAIKAQRWDKASYVYAMDNMFMYRYWDSYKKPELIERFYEAIKDYNNFRKIEKYTTFRDINCLIPELIATHY